MGNTDSNEQLLNLQKPALWFGQKCRVKANQTAKLHCERAQRGCVKKVQKVPFIFSNREIFAAKQ